LVSRPCGMTVEEIARALGLKRVGNVYRGACPHCGGRKRFQVRAGSEGVPLIWCWGCQDSQTIVRELQRGGLWPKRDWTPDQRREFLRQRRRDEMDTLNARPFADAAAVLLEESLEEMEPWDLERAALTQQLAALRTESGMLAKYRSWQEIHPEWTRALVEAGKAHQKRLTALLDNFVDASEREEVQLAA